MPMFKYASKKDHEPVGKQIISYYHMNLDLYLPSKAIKNYLPYNLYYII